MKLVINLVLIALVALLSWVLIGNIKDPIEFQGEKSRRKDAVVKKLKNIRTAQELYRGVTGEFAGTFDTLKQVLNEGSFKIINVTGDPDDPNNPDAVIYDTIFTPAIDSVKSLNIVLTDMEIIPFTDGKTFNIAADTISYQQTNVPVCEVGTTWETFMGKFADPKYAKYDNSYDPKAAFKFGNMGAPQLGGTWD